MSASTAAGRQSVAMTKSAASTTPAITAAVRLRPAAIDPLAVRAGPAGRPDRCCAQRRRDVPGGGRRCTPEGSVPIVIRPGSRRGGVVIGCSPVCGLAMGVERSSVYTWPVDSDVDTASLFAARIGRVVAPHRRFRRERGPHVDVVVLVLRSGDGRRLQPRHLARWRLGPVRQWTGVVGTEAEPALAGVIALTRGAGCRSTVPHRGTAARRTHRSRRRAHVGAATCRRSSPLPGHCPHRPNTSARSG